MNSSLKTKDLTFLSLLLASGIVIKYITDTFTRTFLFFLMIDPLMLVNGIIFTKYKKPVYLFTVMVIETVLSATLFMTTDFWLLRPINILITYLVCNLFSKRKPKLILFLSTFFSMVVDIVLAFLLFVFFPGITGVDSTQLLTVMNNISDMFSGNALIIIYGLAFVLMCLWATIPSLINMFLGNKVLNIFQKKGGVL